MQNKKGANSMISGRNSFDLLTKGLFIKKIFKTNLIMWRAGKLWIYAI